MRDYRFSALGSALAHMWRGWPVIVPVVMVNAAAQALLVAPDATPIVDQAAVGVAVLSAILFLAGYGLIAATALHVDDGDVGWTQAGATLRPAAMRYCLWAIGLGLAIAIGLALYTVPGLLVMALTPFLLLAALDGHHNPLAANFRTIGRRFWRWLVTMLITGLVVVVGTLVVGLTTFFVRGLVASLLVWLVAGFVVAWFTTAWALIYRDSGVALRG